LWLELHRGDRPFSYGDVSFTFSLPSSSPAIIVLQQLDTRFFRGMTGPNAWQFDFVVFKKGHKEPVASSVKTSFWRRSVSLEVPLEAGEYVVHVRLDARDDQNDEESDNDKEDAKVEPEKKSKPIDNRKLQRVAAARSIAQSLAINFSPLEHTSSLPLPLSTFAGHDLTELELMTVEAKTEEDQKRKAMFKKEEIAKTEAHGSHDESVHLNSMCDGCSMCPIVGPRYKCLDEACPDYDLCETCAKSDVHPSDHGMLMIKAAKKEGGDVPVVKEAEEAKVKGDDEPVHWCYVCNGCKMDPIAGARYKCLDSSCPDYDLCAACVAKGAHPAEHRMLKIETPDLAQPLIDNDGSVPLTLGLRVYTKLHAPANIRGQLRHGQGNIKWSKV